MHLRNLSAHCRALSVVNNAVDVPWPFGKRIAGNGLEPAFKHLKEFIMTYETEMQKQADRDVNRDPLSGTPGAHPIGTGVGAALGGAAAGAAVGTVAGPVGTIIGAAVGAVAGGLAGKEVAEIIDPTLEETYWRENYTDRPYANGAGFDEFAPAYRYGVETWRKYPGGQFDDLEPELARGWETYRGASSLEWESAQPAARDAWDRLEENYRK